MAGPAQCLFAINFAGHLSRDVVQLVQSRLGMRFKRLSDDENQDIAHVDLGRWDDGWAGLTLYRYDDGTLTFSAISTSSRPTSEDVAKWRRDVEEVIGLIQQPGATRLNAS